jgi:hypothetical protein
VRYLVERTFLGTCALKVRVKLLTVEDQVFAAKGAPIPENDIIDIDVTLPSYQFHNGPSFIVAHSESSLVL